MTKTLDQAMAGLPEIGYLDIELKEDIDFVAEINKLRKQKNAIILAHYYQEGEVQDIADYVGDSLGLAQQAASTNADIILFAGVHFMAETAKILNPSKKVIIPDLLAGCSLADDCPPDKFEAFIKKHPGHVVVSYINCSAEVKALSHYICTSSNASTIINSVPKEQPIIFAPDKNLGNYLKRLTGRDMVIWDGSCIVHHEFSELQIKKLKEQYPNAKVIAHPECSSYLLDLADFVGSTTALLKYTKSDPSPAYIVATELGILHQMIKANPQKKYIPAPAVNSCVACQQCPYMKLNTLKKLYLCLQYEEPEINVPEKIRKQALKPIERMLKLSA